MYLLIENERTGEAVRERLVETGAVDRRSTYGDAVMPISSWRAAC
jgi:hypothetical protein